MIPTSDLANYAPAQPIFGDLNDQLLGTDFWTDEMVAAAGIPIVDVPFVTIGGGIGSFVTVDYLRIAGVPTSSIKVFTALEREKSRIRYDEMLVRGLVRIVRRRAAVGYPGLKFLPELQEYRTQQNDYRHIVNAYESHEHVYERLMQSPSTVPVRGGGIVASRVLQRLMDDRLLKGANTQIVHLFRTFINGPNDGNKRGFCKRIGPLRSTSQWFKWLAGTQI